MARALKVVSDESDGDDGEGPSRESFLVFIDEYVDLDQKVAEAVGERKDLRARIKGVGLKLGPFDRARREGEKSGQLREADDREFRRYMEWLGKPMPYAPLGNGEDHDAGPAVSEHQLRQIEAGGYAWGQSGKTRASNPWTPGTISYQTWDEAWVRGADALAGANVKEEPPAPAEPPKRRGRPRGSRNKEKAEGGDLLA